MQELKSFLVDHPHVKVVYFVGENWYINKPNKVYEAKTREEILDAPEGKKKSKKEQE